MTKQPIKFSVELTPDQSLAFVQFLKRLGLSDYRLCASDDDEAFDMQRHGKKSAKS